MKLNLLALVALGGTLCQAAPTNSLVLPTQPSADRPLAARFETPPAAARILRILHQQHDNPTLQDKQLKQLAGQGFGGFVGNVK